MRKPYNYRNPTPEVLAAEIERRELRNEIIGMLAFGLAVLNLVGWATVLK